MSLYDQLIETYPELTIHDFDPIAGKIMLRDDSDGQGAYVAKWDYEKPIPAGLKLGK